MRHDEVMLRWRLKGLDLRIGLLCQAQAQCADHQSGRRVALGRQIMSLRAKRWKLVHSGGIGQNEVSGDT